MTDVSEIAEQKSFEAVAATATAQEAIERSREAQMANAVATAVKDVFALKDNEGQKRFVDISRVPLICQAILGIHQSLDEIKANMVNRDQFWPVKTLVYGLVTVLLTGLIGEMLLQAINIPK